MRKVTKYEFDREKIREFTIDKTLVPGRDKANPKRVRRAWVVLYNGQPVTILATKKEATDFIYEKALT